MDTDYLLFGHDGARYALSAIAVQQIVWVPALAPVAELPAYIVGAFNLRGRVVPVIDLNLRFGRAPVAYQVGDRVIVLQCAGDSFGLIAQELYDVRRISPSDIEAAADEDASRLVRGEAMLADGLAMVLDEKVLMRGVSNRFPEMALASAADAESAHRRFGKLTSASREMLQERARNLAQRRSDTKASDVQAYCLFRIEDQLFGLELAAVSEFAHARGVTEVPCCPPHIAGSMNLRGDILTVVDLRPALGMECSSEMKEVVVVRTGEITLGLSASEIVDVVAIARAEVTAAIAATGDAERSYCKGLASVRGRAVGLLDLEKMLATRVLHVAETV